MMVGILLFVIIGGIEGLLRIRKSVSKENVGIIESCIFLKL